MWTSPSPDHALLLAVYLIAFYLVRSPFGYGRIASHRIAFHTSPRIIAFCRPYLLNIDDL